ncbi:hypothetical protein KKI24_03480, partial [bacterium]|nr:hypothetical protein [bacterium]
IGDYHRNGSTIEPSWDRLTIGTEPDGPVAIYSLNRLLRTVSLTPDFPGSDTTSRPASGRTASSEFDLLDLTGENGLYTSPESDPRSRILRACIHLCQPMTTNELGLALCEVVSLLALEATDLTLPLVFSRILPAREIVIAINEDTTADNLIRLQETPDGQPIHILAEGRADGLSLNLKNWFDRAFLKNGPDSTRADQFRQQVAAFQSLFSGNGYWGRWAHFLIDQTTPEVPEPLSIPEPNRQRLFQGLQRLGFSNPTAIKKESSFKLEVNWTAETDRIVEEIRRLPEGKGSLQGMILTSRPLTLRQTLQRTLENILDEKGYQSTLTVLNAYKPGLCWLLEQVLPVLKNLHSLDRLEISYRPFPTGRNTLELRSRWLQELFPGPDLLARDLNLGIEQVRVFEADDPIDIYRVIARDNENRVLWEQSFSPRYLDMAYLTGDPETGRVHPCTSGILLQNESRIVLDQNLPSDRISFWTEFQSNWLPELEKRMADRLAEESAAGQAAFWKELRIDVYIDETDARLGFGDERIGPMEALHEDLYFTMLDFFNRFATLHCLPPEIQLGQVIPKVYTTSPGGAPYATLSATPLIWSTIPKSVPRFLTHQSAVAAVGREKGSEFVDIRCHNTEFNPEERRRFVSLASAWGYHAEWRGHDLRLDQSLKENATSAEKYPAEPVQKKIPRNRMLTSSEVRDWIGHLDTLPHLSTWTAGFSWQGRPIPVVEAVLNPERKKTSLAKMRLLKPTLLFNARHHANEISSTSATLELAQFLAEHPEGKELLKIANVVMIPMENPDGVALLEDLLPDCPGHKLHAARYNALGCEFYGEYFRDPPRFPEALAKTKAWQRWLPEIVVDQHGVPGHEWDQPFSGYAPYRFREFWIPRTFAYVYVPFIRDSTHPNHADARRIAGALSRAMSEENDIVQQNHDLSERYRRYACGPEPDVFPASGGEPLLVLPLQERIHKTNCAVRFPDITKSEIIVELPDEVVSGQQFALCVRANRLIQKTLIQLCQKTVCSLDIQPDATSGSCRLRYHEPDGYGTQGIAPLKNGDPA